MFNLPKTHFWLIQGTKKSDIEYPFSHNTPTNTMLRYIPDHQNQQILQIQDLHFKIEAKK